MAIANTLVFNPITLLVLYFHSPYITIIITQTLNITRDIMYWYYPRPVLFSLRNSYKMLEILSFFIHFIDNKKS